MTPGGLELVGRQDELALCAAALAGPALLTVCGIGGTGKSALARAVAAQRDGLVVELQHHVPGESVARAVLEAAGERVLADVDAARVLLTLRRTRTALLVLDNAEQVRDEVVRLARDLAVEVPVLVTSRVPLRIEQERVLELGGLPVDGVDSPAVQLFQRRRRVLGEAADTAAVLDLCRAVDGHPLALELAAAQSRVRRPEELAQLLRDGRQKDLAAVVATTLELLEPPQRRLLEAVAVFANGADVDAVEFVAGCDVKDAPEQLQLLLETGLVRRRDDAAGVLLEVHPLVRQHVRSEGEDATQVRHAQWVLEALATMQDATSGPQAAARAAHLSREAVPAAELLADVGREQEAAWVLITIADAAGAAVVMEPLAQAAQRLRPRVAGPLGAHLGYVALEADVRAGGDVIAALRDLSEEAEAVGAVAVQVEAEVIYARHKREAGDLPAAARALETAVARVPEAPETALCTEFDRPALRAYIAVEQAALLRAEGRPVEQVLAALRAADAAELRARPASSLRTRLGVALVDAGEVEEGRRTLRSLLGSMWPDMHVHQWLGWVLLRDPLDLEGAERHLSTSAAAYEDLGWSAWTTSVEIGRVVVRLRRDQPREALQLTQQLLERPNVSRAWLATLRLCRAQAQRMLGETSEAARSLEEVLADPAAPPVVRAGGLGERALLRAAAGDSAGAAKDATAAGAEGLGGQPEQLVVGLLHQQQWRALAGRAARLTPRQRDALRAVAGGQTVGAAARQLGIAPKTLEKHLENAYAALGASNRLEALRLAGLLA